MKVISSDKSFQVIKVREVRIVKEMKGVIACDVSPVAMFNNYPQVDKHFH